MTTIAKCFPDTPMYYSHKGLLAILVKHKIKEIKDGDCFIFINRAGTSCKVLTGSRGNFLSYFRSPDNRPFSLEALAQIPRYLGGEAFECSKSLELMLRKRVPQMFLEEDAKVRPIKVANKKQLSKSRFKKAA